MKKNRILALEVFQKSTFTEKAPARIKKKSASHAAWEQHFQICLIFLSYFNYFVIFCFPRLTCARFSPPAVVDRTMNF